MRHVGTSTSTAPGRRVFQTPEARQRSALGLNSASFALLRHIGLFQAWCGKGWGLQSCALYRLQPETHPLALTLHIDILEIVAGVWFWVVAAITCPAAFLSLPGAGDDH